MNTLNDAPFEGKIYVCERHHALTVHVGKPPSKAGEGDGTGRELRFTNGILVLTDPEDIEDFQASLKHMKRFAPAQFGSIIDATNDPDLVGRVSTIHRLILTGQTNVLSGTLTADAMVASQGQVRELQDQQEAMNIGAQPSESLLKNKAASLEGLKALLAKQHTNNESGAKQSDAPESKQSDDAALADAQAPNTLKIDIGDK